MKHTSGKVGHSRCVNTSRRWIRTLLGTRERGSESFARNALGRYERASEKTSKTACVHGDDAHERSCTPDDHETERSSEWIRNLETFSERVGAGTQRTVASDADACSCCSVRLWETKVKPWRSGNDLCDSMKHKVQTRFRDTIKAAILAHNPQDPEWRRHVGLNATRLQEYDALKSEWKAMHQAYRQWGIADGDDTTPMEVDAPMKGKGKNKGKGKGKEKGKEKGKGKGQEKGKGKSKDKAKGGTSDMSNVKRFFCKEKGFSAWLAEKKTVGHEQSANSIEGKRMDFRFGSSA